MNNGDLTKGCVHKQDAASPCHMCVAEEGGGQQVCRLQDGRRVDGSKQEQMNSGSKWLKTRPRERVALKRLSPLMVKK
jgi:hypothetical protein